MNVVEAYITNRKGLIIFISGISGCGRTELARHISHDFNLPVLDLIDYYKKDFSLKKTLPNGVEVTTWDTDDAIDWDKLNEDITKIKPKGVIVNGIGFPDDKILTKPTYHLHVSVKKQLCMEKRRKFLVKHQDKYPTEFGEIGTDTEKLKMNQITFPYYIDVTKRSRINKFITANEINDEQIYDMAFESLIKYIEDKLYATRKDLVKDDSDRYRFKDDQKHKEFKDSETERKKKSDESVESIDTSAKIETDSSQLSVEDSSDVDTSDNKKENKKEESTPEKIPDEVNTPEHELETGMARQTKKKEIEMKIGKKTYEFQEKTETDEEKELPDDISISVVQSPPEMEDVRHISTKKDDDDDDDNDERLIDPNDPDFGEEPKSVDSDDIAEYESLSQFPKTEISSRRYGFYQGLNDTYLPAYRNMIKEQGYKA